MLPTLLDHPKFRRLVLLLNVKRAHAIGHLELLWRTGYAQGNPIVGDAVDVELAAEWKGKKGQLCAALVETRFLDTLEDGRFQIHDLLENAPSYVRLRHAHAVENQRPKTCERCGARFFSTEQRSRFCKDACRQAGHRDRHREENETPTKPDAVTQRNAPSNAGVTQRNAGTRPGQASTGQASPDQERERDAGALALRPPITVFTDAWNRLTTPPIPRCSNGLTPKRKTHITARLSERSQAEWETVMQRIEASGFCRGDNDRGWRASFDWLVGTPDVAVKVLEGKYDNTPRRAPNVIIGSLKTAGNKASLNEFLRRRGHDDLD